jgi:anaerobic selenocysteine-containing dehydrogenase
LRGTLESQRIIGEVSFGHAGAMHYAKPDLSLINGQSEATLWELTTRRCDPAFFTAHSVMELRGWSDYDLEQAGRLTHPMRYDRVSDRYTPCGWDEAFSTIGTELKAINPKSAVFYASGRASLETAYCYALFARLYGHNNLPDSSNMCHETTSVSLKKAIGSPVGTVIFDDLAEADAFFFFGQNTGSNSPRFLHPLQEAASRNVPIVTFNPSRERGLGTVLNLVCGAILPPMEGDYGYRERDIGPAFGWPRSTRGFQQAWLA